MPEVGQYDDPVKIERDLSRPSVRPSWTTQLFSLCDGCRTETLASNVR